MNFYYIRVSAIDQNESRQAMAAEALGIPQNRVYQDKLSGKDTKRPGLNALLTAVKAGDTVIVESISRFARNTRDLLGLVERLTANRVEFVSQKENIDTNTATGWFMLTIFGAVAELEREYIRQRQTEGITAARTQGKHLGRPIKPMPKGFDGIAKRWKAGEIKLSKALEECGGISAPTFYRRLAGTPH